MTDLLKNKTYVSSAFLPSSEKKNNIELTLFFISCNTRPSYGPPEKYTTQFKLKLEEI